MSGVTIVQFLEAVRQANIVASARIDIWENELADLEDARQVAGRLVEQGHLTAWQARYLLSGRRRLRFGNFVLTRRLSRDDVGDRFVGRHVRLDRQVDMLFFSVPISRMLAERGDWLRDIAAAADIDHPHLQHVHLIDRDSGRLMVVRDDLSGRTVNDPEQIVSMEPQQVLPLLRRLAEALAIVHEHGFAFGDLTESNLYIDSEGKLTVSGLIESLVQQKVAQAGETGESSQSTGDRRSDVQAFVTIGRKLLARLFKSRTDAGHGPLRELLNELAKGEVDLSVAASRLARWDHESGRTDVASGDATRMQPDQSSPTSKPVEPNTTAGSSNIRKKRAATIQSILPWNHTTTAITLAALALVVAVTLWSIRAMNDRSDSERLRSAKAMNDASVFEREHPTSVPFPTPAITATPVNKEGTMTQDETTYSSTHRLPSDDSQRMQVDEEPGNPPLIEKRPGPPSRQPDANRQPPSDKAAATEKAISETAAILTEFRAARKEDDRDHSRQISEETTADNDEPENNEVAANPANAPEEPRSEKVFPQAVDLPLVSVTEPVNLAHLPWETETASLQLLSDANICKRRIQIEWDDMGPQRGTVQLRDERDRPARPVAEFALEGDALRFQWHSGAAESRYSDYLRNCVLKVKTADSEHYLSLRQPIAVEGYTVDRDQPRTRVALPKLDFLPAHAVAELGPWIDNEVGAVIAVDDQVDRQFMGKRKLRVDFSDLAEYRLLFLVLTCELKNRSFLEASLNLQLAPNRRAVPATAESLNRAKSLLEGQFETLRLTHDQLKSTPIDDLRQQLNLSKEQLKNSDKLAKLRELKAEMQLAEERAKFFRETLVKLERLYDRPIPVTIHFEVAGHRVVMASNMIDQ